MKLSKKKLFITLGVLVLILMIFIVIGVISFHYIVLKMASSPSSAYGLKDVFYYSPEMLTKNIIQNAFEDEDEAPYVKARLLSSVAEEVYLNKEPDWLEPLLEDALCSNDYDLKKTSLRIYMKRKRVTPDSVEKRLWELFKNKDEDYLIREMAGLLLSKLYFNDKGKAKIIFSIFKELSTKAKLSYTISLNNKGELMLSPPKILLEDE